MARFFILQVFVLSYFVDNKDRVNALKEWHSSGGILITGYDMYRNLVNHSFIRSKKMKEEIKRCLQDPGNISIFLSCFTVTIQYLIFVYATNDHSQKKGGFCDILT